MIQIPAHTKMALNNYVENKYSPGGFLWAVLSNDLFGAVGLADKQNREALSEIVSYVYNYLPSNSWGSEEKVRAWLNNSM